MALQPEAQGENARWSSTWLFLGREEGDPQVRWGMQGTGSSQNGRGRGTAGGLERNNGCEVCLMTRHQIGHQPEDSCR